MPSGWFYGSVNRRFFQKLSIPELILHEQLGIIHFDTASMEWGLRVYPGAAKNSAKKELAFMLAQIGIETGIDAG